MAIFNSKLLVYQRVDSLRYCGWKKSCTTLDVVFLARASLGWLKPYK